MVGLQKTSGNRCLTSVAAIPKVKEPERMQFYDGLNAMMSQLWSLTPTNLSYIRNL